MKIPDFKFMADASVLPVGFQYPQDYQEFSIGNDLPELMPWSFLWEVELQSLIDGLKNRFPSRLLVPFARRVDCDDVACFEGSDSSGNPLIHIVHDYASPGWEQRGILKSFTEWLGMAEEDAAEWRTAQEDDE